ncbi:MAG TPA: PQQ-dependent sugar dehydrogenase [Flavitalea sp.]|nr:PQQ-dependent sugar dehydrogenase [Flavitalea sp.]
MLCIQGSHQRFSNGRTTASLPTVNQTINLFSDTVVNINVDIIAKGLDVPWEIIWGPENWVWFTEQKGLIRKVNPVTGQIKTLLRIPDVHEQRAVGLLGLAFHPDFKRSPYVFTDYSYLDGVSLFLKIVRYEYIKDSLINPFILVDSIPATETHNGSRLVFDAAGRLLLTTGDIDEPRLSQNLRSPNGKVLRLNIDGTIPWDNPNPGSPIWSWGHRNSQGLVMASNGILYSSEHGDVSDDEVNIIRKGGNYGWPAVQGFCDDASEQAFCTDSGVIPPMKIWTPTIAPSGLDYYGSSVIPQWKNSLLMCSLKDASMRVLKLNQNGTSIISEEVYFPKVFGRLRDICVSPEGDVFISTSNRDWNKSAGSGFPTPDDDRIIKISAGKNSLHSAQIIRAQSGTKPLPKQNREPLFAGKVLYSQYCESCHKNDGQGIAGIFPPLKKSARVTGDKKELINVLLNGLSGSVINGKRYTSPMSAFYFLSDADIAGILTYTRNSFGNKAGPVSSLEIGKARKKSVQK